MCSELGVKDSGLWLGVLGNFRVIGIGLMFFVVTQTLRTLGLEVEA